MIVLTPHREPPLTAVIKRNALELTHELHERGYETDGEARYIPTRYIPGAPLKVPRDLWQLEFAKSKTVYRCELYKSGFMQIVNTSAYNNTAASLLDEFEVYSVSWLASNS